MKSHLDASFAGSSDGSGRRRAVLIAGLGALISLVLGVSVAAAASPAVTIEPASEIGVTSARAEGTVNPNGKETTFRFEYMSDEAFNAEISEVQEVVIFGGLGGGGGNFSLGFGGQETPEMSITSSAASVQSALDALSSIGGVGGSVAVVGTNSGQYSVTFGGSLANTNVENLAVVKGQGYAQVSQEGHAQGFGGANVAGEGTLQAGDPATTVEATLENLAPGATYHLRLVATNADGSGAAVAPTFAAKAATAPTATVDPATEVRYTTAHLSGAIDPEGGSINPIDGPLPINWEFQYTTDPASGWSWAGSGTISGPDAASTSPIPVAAAPGYLADETEYHYRLVAYYAGGGSAASAEGSFETEGPITPPLATVDPVSAITGTSAHFSGEVTAGGTDPGFNANCTFLYITDAAFQPRNEQQRLIVTATGGTYTLGFTGPDFSSDTTAPIAFDASAATVQAALEALSNVAPGDVTVSGGPGNAAGSNPYTIEFAGALAETGLEPLNADGNALTGTGADTAVSTLKEGHAGFEGADQVPCSPESITGTAATPVTAQVRELKPGNAYHVRLRAQNGGGTTVDDTTFATPVIAPRVRTGSAHVSPTTAAITGQINPNGGETTYYFEYGPSLEQKTAEKTIVAGNDPVAVSETLTGLTPSTSYQYRLVATNPVATVPGAAKSFTTDRETADPCPNAAFRTGFAANLPDCRAYELVNPPGRDYGDVMRMPTASDDGNDTGFMNMAAGDQALGAQVGSFMLAHRTSSGWVTQDSNLALIRGHNRVETTFIQAYSNDLTRALFNTSSSLDDNDVAEDQDLYRLDVGQGTAQRLSYGPLSNPNALVRALGASEDLSRVVFQTGSLLLPEAVDGIWGLEDPIYVRDGDQLELVSVLPDGTPVPAFIANGWGDRGIGVTAYLGARAPHGGMHIVSDDARKVFFNTGDQVFGSMGPLYLRDMTASPPRTILVSASERTGEEGSARPARLIGASHDGSVAYLESPEQLTDAATPGGGIYRADLDAPAGQRLEQITPAYGNPAPQGTGDNLGGLSLRTAIMSDDASHVYFTTTALLTPDAVEGMVNAYVSDGQTTKLVASFGKPAEGGSEGEEGYVARVSRDGRFAIFTSRYPVDGAPTDGHQTIYEYDDSSGDFACASCRPDGSPSQGDSFLTDYPHAPLVSEVTQPRNIADDGTVFFGSQDRIVAGDQTTYTDIYEYRAGKVALLTSGQGDRASFPADNSDDGKTVFVISPTAFLAQDKDANELDAYAIRVDGGFPQPPPAAAPCEGEACRGAVSTPPPAVAPGTPNFIGAGNAKSGRNQGRKHHKKHHKRHQKKKHHHKKSHNRDASRNGRTGR